MQADTSNASRAASAGPSFTNNPGTSTPVYLPNTGYNPSLSHAHLLQPGFSHQQQHFASDLNYSGARDFQHLAQESSPNDQFRTQSVPRAIHYPSFPAIDPAQHLQQQQASFQSLGYSSGPQNLASNSYPIATYGSNFAGPSYSSDYGAMASSSIPMMRYGSYMSEDMSRSGSSHSTQAPMTQQDIDNLLAMSRAQAKNLCDATAFPCTYCDKVYTGKHARSIWRRHLQDKHNIPLSAQPRRTRWDGDANRPKNAEERRARMLESKRRWARKKRLQEKQAARGENFTPMGDFDEDDEDHWDDDGADADVSNLSASFTGADDSFTGVKPVLADKATIVKADSAKVKQEWENEKSPFYLHQADKVKASEDSHKGPGNITNAMAARDLYTSTQSRDRRPGPMSVSMLPPQESVAAAVNDSFSSNSSDNSQPGSANFFNDSFGGRTSNSGSESANTSISTPTSAGLPLLESIDKVAVDAKLLPPVKKADTREAAIQLLALRSNSNSPSDNRDTSRRASPGDDGHGQWASTPSRARQVEQSNHAALSALSRPAASPRSVSMNNLHDAHAGHRSLRRGPLLSEVAISGRRLSDTRAPGETSPSPASRTLAAGSAAVRSATTAGSSAIPFATPGPASRTSENPFSLDKHKISPYERRRKLSYSGGQGSPVASPTSQAYGATAMDRSLSSSAALGRSSLGPKLPPLVSTPIRSANLDDSRSSQQAREDNLGGDIAKFESLPPFAASAGPKAVTNGPLMATPFSKGFSAMRRPGTNAPGSTMRPSPSRHLLDDQFSSPQHLNLTESLGLAPHSSSRTSSSYSGFYASSLGLTPSVTGMSGGGMMGTPFHSAIGGGLASLGGFTPLSTHKASHGGMSFWPDSLRKSANFSGSFQSNGSPSVFPTYTKSSSQPNPVDSVRSALPKPHESTSSSAGGRKRKLASSATDGSAGKSSRKADIFDADLVRSAAQPTSDDAFGDLHDDDDDDDDDENLMSIQALDTPSRPTAHRKFPRATAAEDAAKRNSLSPHKASSAHMAHADIGPTQQRTALQSLSTNNSL